MSLDDWVKHFDQFEVCLMPNKIENGIMQFNDKAYHEKIGSFKAHPAEEYFLIRTEARAKMDENCTWIQVKIFF